MQRVDSANLFLPEPLPVGGHLAADYGPFRFSQNCVVRSSRHAGSHMESAIPEQASLSAYSFIDDPWYMMVAEHVDLVNNGWGKPCQ